MKDFKAIVHMNVIANYSVTIKDINIAEQIYSPNIVTMNTDGSNVQQLTTDGRSKISASWSPIGNKIAFAVALDNFDGGSCNNCGDSEIYTIDSNGGNLFKVTDNGWDDTYPTWSPDGTKIAFIGRFDNSSNGAKDLIVMDASGNNRQLVMRNVGTGSASGAPAWSPDGDKIAFVLNSVEIEFGTNYEVFTANADGTDVQNLTGSYALPNILFSPTWAPDGSRIAFATFASGPTGIFVIDSDGSNLRQVFIDPASPTFTALRWAQ